MERFELVTLSATPEVFLYGIFGAEIKPEVFQTFMHEARPYSEILLRIHSRGGDPDQGLSMITELQEARKKQTLITQNDGLAASFGSVIFALGEKRRMAKYAKLMLHQCTVSEFKGQAKDLREMADQVDTVNDMMASIYAEATGKSKDWVKEKWMADGKDTWLTAKQALQVGLATEIIDGEVKKNTETNPAKLAAFYDETLFNVKPNSDTMTKLSAYIPQLNKVPGIQLSAEATDVQISAAMDQALGKTVTLAAELEAKKAELEEAKTTALKEKGQALVASFVGVSITADEKDYHELQACASEAGYQATKKHLEGLPKIENVDALIQSGEASGLKAQKDREGKALIDKGYKDLFKNHGKFLAQLKTDDPKLAAEKYEADFGCAPTWAPQ